MPTKTKGLKYSIIDLERFIQATRDSGYKSTTSAVAELVDNSIQAGATDVRIFVADDGIDEDFPITIGVADNGCGMSASVLREALRFGGSSRFGSRDGLGRFGMGLPNASLSQSKRVEVITWTRRQSAWTSYLDVDEIAAGNMAEVPRPEREVLPEIADEMAAESGTLVCWSLCDRLDNRRVSTLVRKSHASVGRVFRHYLWNGVSISINEQPVIGLDPLYLNTNAPFTGATEYAEPLEFSVRVSPMTRRTGQVRVIFSELPVEEWCDLPVAEKRVRGIANGAGVSVVRAGREIDYGWFFMGSKRRENYDDWWRCEVHFEPLLDEAFGITHTKQQIRPQEYLLEAIAPDLEEIAKALNARVRARHGRAKASSQTEPIELQLTRSESKLPSLPARRSVATDTKEISHLARLHRSLGANGSASRESVQYRLIEDDQPNAAFFRTLVDNERVVVVLNTRHPFYHRFYRPIIRGDQVATTDLAAMLHALLLSAGRAEAMASRKSDRAAIAEFREHWGRALGLLANG